MLNICCHSRVARRVERFISIANVNADTMSENIDGETNNEIVVFNGRHKEQTVVDLL
jgi:hypothetical protein